MTTTFYVINQKSEKSITLNVYSTIFNSMQEKNNNINLWKRLIKAKAETDKIPNQAIIELKIRARNYLSEVRESKKRNEELGNLPMKI